MQLRHHPLRNTPPGTERRIDSWHFGPASAGRKAYFQAALHADELPGMLVAHHLSQRLQALEDAGRLLGEVVVVPVANPIGLAQTLMQRHQGRFEFASGENFNRHYPVLFDAVLPLLDGRLGDDLPANTALVRSALREAVAALPEAHEAASLRKTLLMLACDAEIVIDLHCDSESLLHLYTSHPLWPQAEPLARLVGARASLLAEDSGGHPFDEALSQVWSQLEAHFREGAPVPMGCLSVTLELRGEADVSHALAAADADALIAFLTHRGLVDGLAPTLPPLREAATPLDATDVLKAPVSGIVVYRREIGEVVRAGDVLLEVVDPFSGTAHPVATRANGLFFAREAQRYARAGRSLAKVAGSETLRSGKLLGD